MGGTLMRIAMKRESRSLAESRGYDCNKREKMERGSWNRRRDDTKYSLKGDLSLEMMDLELRSERT